MHQCSKSKCHSSIVEARVYHTSNAPLNVLKFHTTHKHNYRRHQKEIQEDKVQNSWI